MNLKDKLKQFVAEKKHNPPIVREKPQLSEILGGRVYTNPFGEYHLVETCYSIDYVHGNTCLGEVLTLDTEPLAFLARDPSLEGMKIDQTLFVDTETTGLAGGTGTYAFLVGMGRFTKGQFIVRQFLMRDYDEERAMLIGICDEMDKATALISFNGKRFDLPLLNDRLTLSRLPRSKRSYQHLDLLYSSQRLWKRKLPSCRLSSLEENILNVHRQNDVPGFEVPQRYFDFLRTGDGNFLKDVLYHNLIDILSLAGLVAVTTLTAQQSADYCSCPWEAEAMGRLYARCGSYSQAIRYFRKAYDNHSDKGKQVAVLEELALLYKRASLWEQAVSAWEKILMEQPENLSALEEMAKYCEHTLKDIPRAIRFSQRGLAVAFRRLPKKVAAFEHRLSRLRQKQPKLDVI